MKYRANRILPSDITPEAVYFNRRQLLTAGIGGLGLAALPPAARSATVQLQLANLKAPRNKAMSTV